MNNYLDEEIRKSGLSEPELCKKYRWGTTELRENNSDMEQTNEETVQIGVIGGKGSNCLIINNFRVCGEPWEGRIEAVMEEWTVKKRIFCRQ